MTEESLAAMRTRLRRETARTIAEVRAIVEEYYRPKLHRREGNEPKADDKVVEVPIVVGNPDGPARSAILRYRKGSEE